MKVIILFFSLFVTSVFADDIFCIVGDAGTGGASQFSVGEAMQRENCKNILYAGDVIYESGLSSVDDKQWKQKFELPFAPLINNGATFYISLGNHDIKSANPDKLLKIHSNYSASHSFYYYPSKNFNIKIGDTCLWSIDSNNFSKIDALSLKESLESTNTCKWKAVFGHHPIISSGFHGDAGRELSKLLEPLLVEFADVYFAGHDHNLADEGDVPNAKGFRQIVSGAGAKLRSVKSCKATSCNFSASTLGFVKAYFKADYVQFDFIDTKNKILYSSRKDHKSL